MRSALLAGIGFVVLVSQPSAQQAPGFAGRWMLESPRELLGQEMVIQQNAAGLLVTHKVGDERADYLISLSGASVESKDSPIKTTRKGKLTDGKLDVTVTSSFPDGQTASERTIWSVSSDGSTLTIEAKQEPKPGAPPHRTVVYERAG